MPSDVLIRVTSPSFSKNPLLRDRLLQMFPRSTFVEGEGRLEGSRLKSFLSDAEGAIVGLEKVDEELLAALPKLRMISKYGVGLDNIDLPACERRRVGIGWKPGVNRLSVAEQTLGFLLGLSRNLYWTSSLLKQGVWKKDGGSQLTGKTVGIIGAGNVGRELIRLLAPFSCRLLVNDIVDCSDLCARTGAIACEKDRIYRESDFVTIHVPLTEVTRGMIDRAALGRMKQTAFLVNTARGEIVRQSDLKAALRDGTIAGAAIDVYESEPPEDLELLNSPKLICTPHIGGNAREAVELMGLQAIQNLKDFFLEGRQ